MYKLVFSPISAATIQRISMPRAAAYKRFTCLRNLDIEFPFVVVLEITIPLLFLSLLQDSSLEQQLL
jgi:hypothetical protein